MARRSWSRISIRTHRNASTLDDVTNTAIPRDTHTAQGTSGLKPAARLDMRLPGINPGVSRAAISSPNDRRRIWYAGFSVTSSNPASATAVSCQGQLETSIGKPELFTSNLVDPETPGFIPESLTPSLSCGLQAARTSASRVIHAKSLPADRGPRMLRRGMRPRTAHCFRVVLTVLALGLACLALPYAPVRGAAAQHKVTLWLDWYPNSDHAGIYVAMAKGFYAAAGLHVTPQIPSGAADAIKLVAHGTGDIGISYEPSVLLSRQQSIPVVATAAIVQRPLNAVLALRTTGITRPRQLEGHTVGVAGDPSDYTDLQALLHTDHGDYHKVHLVNVGYNLLPALLSHRVDAIIGAYWTWEALQAEAAGKPVNVLRLDAYGVPTYNELVFITGKSQLAHEPDVLRAFQRATFQGYAYAAAHPAEATAILLKVPGVLSTSRSLIQHSITLLAPIFKDSHGRYGTMDAQAWQAYADWMTNTKLMAGHLDASQALTNTLVPS